MLVIIIAFALRVYFVSDKDKETILFVRPFNMKGTIISGFAVELVARARPDAQMLTPDQHDEREVSI